MSMGVCGGVEKGGCGGWVGLTKFETDLLKALQEQIKKDSPAAAVLHHSKLWARNPSN